jgi:hypothetical protein
MIQEARKKVNRPNVRFHHKNVMNIEFAPTAIFMTGLFTMQFLTLAEQTTFENMGRYCFLSFLDALAPVVPNFNLSFGFSCRTKVQYTVRPSTDKILQIEIS